MDKVVRCVRCGSEFGDETTGAMECPQCGTKEKPDIIGVAASAQKMVDEYHEVKPLLVAGRMTADRMTDRQQAGLLIVCYGRSGVGEFWRSLTRQLRRGYLRKWPKLLDALAEAGVRLD